MDKHIDALLELRLGCRFDSEWSQQAAEQVAALDAAIALMRGQSETCAWQKDDDEWEGAQWDSACGEKYVFVEGGPADNGHKFCHGCGKPMIIIEPQEPAE